MQWDMEESQGWKGKPDTITWVIPSSFILWDLVAIRGQLVVIFREKGEGVIERKPQWKDSEDLQSFLTIGASS